MQHIGKRIRRLLDREEISHASFARSIKMSRQLLSYTLRIETPRLENVRRIAAGLGLSVSAILFPPRGSKKHGK